MRIVALYYFMYTELRGTCTEYSTSGAPAESVAYPLFLLHQFLPVNQNYPRAPKSVGRALICIISKINWRFGLFLIPIPALKLVNHLA